MTLRELLDRLLAGQEAIRSLGELELLRRIASFDELERLEPIARQFVDSERQQRIPAPPTDADVERILQHPADATVDQLQNLLRRATELTLSTSQVEGIRAVLTKLSAERFRGEGKPNVLSEAGWKSTPVGLLDPHAVLGFDRLRLLALSRIDSCVDHERRNCRCYSDVREWLWQTLETVSEKTPEAWYAARLLDELDAHARLRAARL